MATWKPDPTFYPSPRMAMKAPAETIAYVAAFDPTRGTPDGLAVVDVDPNSKTYSTILDTVMMPNVGDELHHFGWNACSSCLCPNAPPARRAALSDRAGLRSSRIHVLDTKPDPRKPKIVKVIEPAEVAERAGYIASSHDPLRARGHLRRRARRRRGQGARRRLPDGPRKLRHSRPLGDRPRPAAACLRRVVASRPRHDRHQRMGHCPDTFENGLGAGDPARSRSTAAGCTSGTCTRASTSRPSTSATSTSSSSSCVPRTTPRRPTASSTCHQPGGPVVLDLDVAPRRRQVGR